MVFGSLLAAAAGPVIGGIAGALGGGRSSGGGGQRTAQVFEPGENENLEEFLDLSFGTTQDVIARGNNVFNNPQRRANAAEAYEGFKDNQFSGLLSGRQGPITAGLNLQNFITENDLFDTDPKFGQDLNQIYRQYDKVVVPKQNEEQVRRAFQNTLGREATGNELLKFTGRLEGGIPGYDYDQLIGDISASQEYKDKFGTGGLFDAYADAYYGKRLTETVPVEQGEQKEYQRPSLDAIRTRYGLGPDFGGYDVFKARQE